MIASTLAVYWQAIGHDFLLYDDPTYVTDNAIVKQGLTVNGIIWAFTAFDSGNWPLIWLSHMLDVELFGLNPAGHHFTNIALHSVNSILLFLLISRLTGTIWRSAIVAAIFAFHPLHVESVAWISERKDTLSALFFMTTLYFYADYVKKSLFSRYILTFAAFAMGLLAKPMLVTIPIAMLLLDYWPLNRFDLSCESARRGVGKIFKEKVPFLLLAAVSSAVTLKGLKSDIQPLENSPFIGRISNSLLSYTQYISKTFIPSDLSAFYPFRFQPPLWQLVGSAALLIIISAIAIREHRHRPYLIVGWLWYLVTLLPVIGLIKVGGHAMADRYTYIPQTGIVIMAVWGIADISKEWAKRRIILTILTSFIITICMVTSSRQLSLWKNSTTLFADALRISNDNFFAHYVLGCVSEKEGRLDEAFANFKAALADNRHYADIYGKLGRICYEQGKLDEAIDYYYKELFVSPLSVPCRNRLGIALADYGKFDEAIDHFTHILSLKPDCNEAKLNLERVLEMKKHP